MKIPIDFGKFQKKDIQKEPKKDFPGKDTNKSNQDKISSFVGNINVPIRVMMAIVTQIRMFDKDSNGLTPKGRNKKELKTEIKHLVSKLSEK